MPTTLASCRLVNEIQHMQTADLLRTPTFRQSTHSLWASSNRPDQRSLTQVLATSATWSSMRDSGQNLALRELLESLRVGCARNGLTLCAALDSLLCSREIRKQSSNWRRQHPLTKTWESWPSTASTAQRHDQNKSPPSVSQSYLLWLWSPFQCRSRSQWHHYVSTIAAQLRI